MGDIHSAGAPRAIGPFHIVRRLGAGGMAEAFECVRTGPGGFEQRVCVKRVLPAYSSDAELRKLFLREARLAAALSHRNITRVVDFGEDAGCHYLALELVEGVDLRCLLRAIPSHRLPVAVAALIGVEVAEALEHAHTRGGRTGTVVHRDVSPANILVSADGDVKLTDFGISKALNDAPITRSDFVRGNVWYMAPEQIAGARTDPRSDLFSLGVVLYQCVAGRRPYAGPTDLAAMMALSEGRRAPLAEVAPEAPTAMVAIVERLLRDDPGGRFQSAGALVEALAPLAEVASARRELRALVREHRHARPKRRAAVQVAPPTLDVDAPEAREEPATVPARAAQPTSPAPSRAGRSEVAGATGYAKVPARWQPYALAPGSWASVDRAAEQRGVEQRGVEQRSASSSEPVELPARPSLWWTALAVLALTLSGGLSCLVTLLW